MVVRASARSSSTPLLGTLPRVSVCACVERRDLGLDRSNRNIHIFDHPTAAAQRLLGLAPSPDGSLRHVELLELDLEAVTAAAESEAEAALEAACQGMCAV
jgi:hypothetical protein